MKKNNLNPHCKLNHKLSNKYIVFCHGFAFDKNFWKELAPYFNDEYCCLFWNLGYFDDAEYPIPPEDAQEVIVIGHSYGLIKLLEAPFRKDAIISIQGFINFFGFGEWLKSVRIQEWKRMYSNFIENHTKALLRIYKLSKLKKVCILKQNINISNLEKDLNALTKVCNLPDLPTLVLGSENDLIVPAQLLEDNFLMRKKVKIVFNNRGGHGLGLEEAEFVYKEIRTFLDGYKSY